MPNYQKQLEELLSLTAQTSASDLHISPGHPPVLRIDGRLVPLIKRKKITPQDSEGLAFALMTDEQRERFLKEKDIDFSYDFAGKARFRINIFFQRNNISVALRLIPRKIRTIDSSYFFQNFTLYLRHI